MSVAHFYHVWAEGSWPEPVNEHVDALNESEFSGYVAIGLVGPSADRNAAKIRILDGLRMPVEFFEFDSGYEQATLEAVREYVSDHSDHIMYAHTKGAHDRCTLNQAWRRSMTKHVVSDWRQCVKALDSDYDTVGCHWLTPGRYDDDDEKIVTTPFYGGNFWWATAEYLRRLPPIGTENRYDAEGWIGLRSPNALDLLPGWPTYKGTRDAY